MHDQWPLAIQYWCSIASYAATSTIFDRSTCAELPHAHCLLARARAQLVLTTISFHTCLFYTDILHAWAAPW